MKRIETPTFIEDLVEDTFNNKTPVEKIKQEIESFKDIVIGTNDNFVSEINPIQIESTSKEVDFKCNSFLKRTETPLELDELMDDANKIGKEVFMKDLIRKTPIKKEENSKKMARLLTVNTEGIEKKQNDILTTPLMIDKLLEVKVK